MSAPVVNVSSDTARALEFYAEVRRILGVLAKSIVSGPLSIYGKLKGKYGHRRAFLAVRAMLRRDLRRPKGVSARSWDFIRFEVLQHAGMRLFRVNDCDTWCAPDVEAAVADVRKTYDVALGDDAYLYGVVEEPWEMSMAGMLRGRFWDEESGRIANFLEQLSREFAESGPYVGMFCSTEY